MQIVKVDIEKYRKCVNTFSCRYFLTQTPEYVEQKLSDGNKVDCFIFKSDDGLNVLGFTCVIYFSVKRIFRSANCLYGPCLQTMNVENFQAALELLETEVLKSPMVIKFTLNPLIPQNKYQDIELIESGCGDAYREVLEKAGYNRLMKEWYEDSSIQVRYIYSKIIAGQSFETIIKSFTPNLKMRIKKVKQLGIKVRMLSLNELDIFDQLLQQTYDRINTISTVRSAYHRQLYRHFGAKVHFPLAYIDCDEALKTQAAFLQGLEAEQSKLDAHYQDHQSKKYLNLCRDLDDQRRRISGLMAQIESLKAQYGAVVNLYGGCYIESGHDMIHLLGGGSKELMKLDGVLAIHALMLQLAVERGLDIYNLYGCSGLTEPNDIDYGVLQFKRGFNGAQEEFIGTFEKVKNQLRFLLP